jgi:hypothetical protein
LESPLIILIPLIALLLFLLFVGAVLLTTAFWGAFALGPIRFSLPNPSGLNRMLVGIVGGFMWIFALSMPIVVMVLTNGEVLSVAEAATVTAITPTVEPDALEAVAVETGVTDEPLENAEAAESIPIPTETPDVPVGPVGTAAVTAGRVQVFDGPGYAYNVAGTADIETEFEIMARTTDSTWLQVLQPLSATKGWLQAKDVEPSVPLPDIPVLEDIPTPPEPATVPRITTITFPDVVGAENASGILTFMDAERDVYIARFERVYGTFPEFTVDVDGPIEAVAFQIFPCGTQLVTLSVTLEDEAGNISQPGLFSFECQQGS